MKVANKNLLSVCWVLLVAPLFVAHLLALITPLPEHFVAVSIFDQGMLFIYPGFIVTVLLGYLHRRPSSFAGAKERSRYVGLCLLHQTVNLGIAMVGVDILFDMLRAMTAHFPEYAIVVMASAALKIVLVGVYGLAHMELFDEWRLYRRLAKKEHQRDIQHA